MFDWFCKISLIALILIVLNSMLGDLLFRVKYSFPKVSATTEHIIDTSKDPIQINLRDEKYIKYRGEKGGYALKLQAEYSISALVVARNNNFWFRDIMRSKFDEMKSNTAVTEKMHLQSRRYRQMQQSIRVTVVVP